MSLDHITYSCATEGCFAIVTVHPQEDERLRQTHELFYCPAGHSMSFSGKTSKEKRIEQLEKQLHLAWERFSERSQDYQELHDVMARAIQVCPLGCGHKGNRRLKWWATDEDYGRFLDRVGRDLSGHLQDAHGAGVTDPVSDEVPADV